MTSLTIAERRRAELLRLAPNLMPAEVPVPWPVLRRSTVASVLVIVAFFGVFVGWASLAPLESAVLSHGIISPAGSRRTVQHLEGGVISKILVRDGDQVKAGDTLIMLNDTQADAGYKITERRLLAQQAMLARLQAEQTGATQIVFPAEVLASKDPDVVGVLQGQQNLFASRQSSLKDQQSILGQQIAQLREQIGGFSQQVSSVARQLELIQSEMKDVETLLAKGLERRPRLLALERAAAALDGQKSAANASIAQAQQKIGEIQMHLVSLDTDRRSEVSDQITKAQGDISQLNEQLRAQSEVRARTQITAPVTGTVVNLRFKSEGGVIQPGEAVLEIVPHDEDLLVDVQISPTDVDSVKIGQKAEVLFTSYRLKFMPRTMGEVTYVSADSLEDRLTGRHYYEVKVRVPPEEKAKLDKVDPPVKLMAGMPAEVFVVTGDTRVMAYLISPLVDILRHTFREGHGP